MDIKGFAVLKDSVITIVINDNLSPEARMEAYEHEIYHIEHDDFYSDRNVDDIENEAHHQH
jgi:hypothetical protein